MRQHRGLGVGDAAPFPSLSPSPSLSPADALSLSLRGSHSLFTSTRVPHYQPGVDLSLCMSGMLTCDNTKAECSGEKRLLSVACISALFYNHFLLGLQSVLCASFCSSAGSGEDAALVSHGNTLVSFLRRHWLCGSVCMTESLGSRAKERRRRRRRRRRSGRVCVCVCVCVRGVFCLSSPSRSERIKGNGFILIKPDGLR